MTLDPDCPTWGWSDDVRPALGAAVAAGRPAALATLFAVDGAAPRPVGSQMLITDDGLSGFLSGGCVESDLAIHARETIADGTPRRIIYGEGGPYWDIKLVCGARIEILVERVCPDRPAVASLLTSWRARTPTLWRTDGRTQACVSAGDAPTLVVKDAPFALARRYDPAWRLVVVGADPTALAIASLGAQAGLETTLVRPKGPQTPPPLPGVGYSRENPAAALAGLGLDRWTAIAVATHDLEVDEDALTAALPSPAGYVGVLGARKRLPERLERLRARGVSAAALKRLHAPIGLPMPGKAPWEIAVSVIAQIMAESQAEPAS